MVRRSSVREERPKRRGCGCFLVSTRLLAICALLVAAGIVRLTLIHEEPGFDTEAAQGISFTPPVRITPGPGMPSDLPLRRSNNNVDVARFGDAFFLAFRDAQSHFASGNVRLYVLRSTDRKNWSLENTIQLPDSDLREPRFLVFRDKLFLYFFRGGDRVYDFEPKSIYMTERSGERTWSEPEAIYKPGYVVWRAKARGDTAYMSVYYGAGLYTLKDRPGEIRLLTSRDGRTWEALTDAPQLTETSAEEAAFEFDEEGNLVTVVRLEMEGSLVGTASKGDLGQWDCRQLPHKYDSSLMFRHGGDFYVIARRNVAGAYHRGDGLFLPESWQRALRLVRYSLTRKRTALYKVDLAQKRLIPLFDFPSQGDTAFAGLVPLDDHSYYVVNYSNAIEGFDRPWILGQWTRTHLYETVLTFPTPRGGSVPRGEQQKDAWNPLSLP